MLIIKAIKFGSNYVNQIKRITKVRVGYDDHVCVSKIKPRWSQQQIIQWQEDMTLPILFKRQLQFEFYSAHEFGYNPEEIQKVLYAKVAIQNFKKPFLQTNVYNANGKVMGRMYFEFTVINDHKVKQSYPEVDTRITVSSILAHFDKYYGQKGHFQLWLDNQNSNTPYINFVAGELLWAQKLTLPVFTGLDQSKILTVKVFIDDINIGDAKISIKQVKISSDKFKKVPIVQKQTNIKCGMIFMDITVKVKKINTEKTFNSARQHQNKHVKSSSNLPVLNKKKYNYFELNPQIRSSKSERKLKHIKQEVESTHRSQKQQSKKQVYRKQVRSILESKLGNYNQQKVYLKNNIIKSNQ